MDYEIPVNKMAKFRAILTEEPVGGKPQEMRLKTGGLLHSADGLQALLAYHLL